MQPASPSRQLSPWPGVSFRATLDEPCTDAAGNHQDQLPLWRARSGGILHRAPGPALVPPLMDHTNIAYHPACRSCPLLPVITQAPRPMPHARLSCHTPQCLEHRTTAVKPLAPGQPLVGQPRYAVPPCRCLPTTGHTPGNALEAPRLGAPTPPATMVAHRPPQALAPTPRAAVPARPLSWHGTGRNTAPPAS